MSSNTGGTMVHSNDLARLIECPVCLELPLPPVYNCINGHIICSNCKPQLMNCGLCQGRFTNIRNLVTESIVEASSMNCVFSAHGCDKIVAGQYYKQHAAICDFRPIQCFDNRTITCQGKPIDYGSFFNHIVKDHKDEGYDEELEWFEKMARCTSFDIEADGPYFYLKYDGRIFIQHTKLRNKTLFWWISLVGSDNEAAKYKSIIKIYNKTKPLKNTLEFQYTIPVCSIRNSAENVVNKRLVGSLSMESLLPFCQTGLVKDGREYKYSWNMKFAIRKVEL